MIVALFALPALMRFVTPMVGAVASGSGAGAGAAVGAMATGAVSMGRTGSGRGNAAPTPSKHRADTRQGTQRRRKLSAKGQPRIPGPRGGGGQPTRERWARAEAAGTAGTAGAGAAPPEALQRRERRSS
jgi:type IV secretion system protein TrbL